jgi:hypothetical protein
MTGWSRRDVLKAGAGAAAIAVPMVALSAGPAAAARPTAAGAGTGAGDGPELGGRELAALGGGQVIFSIRHAARGEVAIYHGRNEVVVQDRALVARIVRAATDAGGGAGTGI